MLRLTGSLDMTIVVDLDVKQQDQQIILNSSGILGDKQL